VPRLRRVFTHHHPKLQRTDVHAQEVGNAANGEAEATLRGDGEGNVAVSKFGVSLHILLFVCFVQFCLEVVAFKFLHKQTHKQTNTQTNKQTLHILSAHRARVPQCKAHLVVQPVLVGRPIGAGWLVDLLVVVGRTIGVG
jgi:hypothetical protein